MRKFKNTKENRKAVTTEATQDCLMSNLQERIDRRVAEARDQIEVEEVEKTTDLKLSPSETVKVAGIALGAYATIALVCYGAAYAAAEIIPPAAQKVISLSKYTAGKVKKTLSKEKPSYSKMNRDELAEKAKALIETLDQMERLIHTELEISGGKFTPEIKNYMRSYKRIGDQLEMIINALDGCVRIEEK